MSIRMKINYQRLGIFKFLTGMRLSMKTMDLMETTAIEDRSHQLKSANAKQPDFQKNIIQILSNVPETGLSSLMGKAKAVRYLRKDVLGLGTIKTNTVLVIFYGEVRSVSDDGNCKEVRIRESYTGFGEVALLTDEMRATAVVTLEKTVFAVISTHDFKNWQVNYPDLKIVFPDG